MKHLFLVLVSTAALSAWQSAGAQSWGTHEVGGAGDWEFRIGPAHIDSKTVDFNGGTTIDLSGTTGIKIGTGYYVSDQLIIGGNFAYTQGDFRGTVCGTQPPPCSSSNWQIEGGHIDYSSLMFDATYLIGHSWLKPFGEVGLGWTWVNTNIASGPPQVGCWWDPWWGYICNGYQPTVGNSSFAWQAGAGLQINFSHSFSLAPAVKWTWVEMHNSTGSPNFLTWELMFNWRFRGYY